MRIKPIKMIKLPQFHGKRLIYQATDVWQLLAEVYVQMARYGHNPSLFRGRDGLAGRAKSGHYVLRDGLILPLFAEDGSVNYQGKTGWELEVELAIYQDTWHVHPDFFPRGLCGSWHAVGKFVTYTGFVTKMIISGQDLEWG